MLINENFVILINILVVLIYIISIISAYKKGLLFEVLNLFGFFLACIIAWFASPVLAKQYPILQAVESLDLEQMILAEYIYPHLNIAAWFLIVLIAVKIVISILLPIFQKVSDLPVIGFFNRLAGSLFGIVSGTIWVFIISMVLSLPYFTNGIAIKEQSVLKPISTLSNQALNIVLENIDIEDFNLDESIDVETYRELFSEWLDKQALGGHTE